MDEIVKTDVNDDEIAPFMQDISRYFEYIDKEELIKKICSREFGRFLTYYADAPEIEVVERDKKGNVKGEKKPQSDRQKRMNKAEPGYHRLFINLGKRDGFYPGELMQTLNRYVGGRQEVGHIDLLDTISYFEVPEKDARKVMTQLTGIRYRGRIVRCNSEDEKAPTKPTSPTKPIKPIKPTKPTKPIKPTKPTKQNLPDEGWAWRKPRKGKKK
jgi:ATP-dependent RNA helicase DeaD